MKSTKTEKKTVLVVDDDERLVDYIREYLSRFEFEVLHASEAGAGQSLVQARTVDVAIVDWMLPGMEGPELIRRLKSMKPDLPVVLITAKGNPESALLAAASGASGFFRKPFRLAEVLAKIRELSKSRAA